MIDTIWFNLVSIVSADGLALLGARTSADTEITTFGPHVYIWGAGTKSMHKQWSYISVPNKPVEATETMVTEAG